MWWGYSSALDVLDECEFSNTSGSCGDGLIPHVENDEITLNVLLVGQSDNRHVLKTLAKKYTHKQNVKMNLYICESFLENVARDLLFLFLALEPAENMGLIEKTISFMELYGNTLIRPSTASYLSSVANQLLCIITDSEYAEKILPMVSFDLLKYKERDQLEIIFKYWASNSEPFDILRIWDERVRKSLAARYDARDGVFDWDYHMRYKSFGAGTLNMQEYKRFRERGISFYLDDTDPCITNKTLLSGIFSAGSKIINCGYLGDIVTGPYPAFGFSCEDPKMLETVNGHSKKTATDVTQNNVMRTFHEIMNQEQFPVFHPEDERYSVMTIDDSNRLRVKSLPNSEVLRQNEMKSRGYKLITVDKCQIILLPTTAMKETLNRQRFENFFDVVTIPQVMMLNYFTPDIVKTIKPNGKIIVDTPKYILNYRKEDLEKYKCDVENLMKQLHCEQIYGKFSYNNDEFMRFQVIK